MCLMHSILLYLPFYQLGQCRRSLTKGRVGTTIGSIMNKKRVSGRVLGELESEIMEIIWRQKDVMSVKDTTEILGKRRKIAYTTVMTIMARLTDKGVLVRRLKGLSYLYKPRVTKEQFIAKAVHGIFSSAVSTLGKEVLTHFVKEIQKINPKKRQQLLKMLSED